MSLFWDSSTQKEGTSYKLTLVNIRWRIRMNGKSISESVFCEVYWEIQQRLETNAMEESDLSILP